MMTAPDQQNDLSQMQFSRDDLAESEEEEDVILEIADEVIEEQDEEQDEERKTMTEFRKTG